MNRFVVAALLGLVAVAAAVVWGIGQFGSSTTVVSEPRAPIVREPEIVPEQAAIAPRTVPSSPAAAPVEPAQPDPSAPTPPPTDPQAAPMSTFRSTLDQPGQSQPAEPQTQAAEPATPVSPSAEPAAEPRVTPQQAGVTQAAPPSGLESQFKARRVTYNRPPEKLALNKPVDVSLVVNATDDEDAGKEALEGFKGEIVERDVELSDTVSAQLTGVGFDITTQTVERQRLSGRTVNRWQWRVTPTEPGEHTLILEIFGYASGSLDAEPLDAYRDVIVVEVEQIDQLVTWAKGVQPLFAVLAALAGIGSAIFAFMRFREEKKQTKAMSSKGE